MSAAFIHGERQSRDESRSPKGTMSVGLSCVENVGQGCLSATTFAGCKQRSIEKEKLLCATRCALHGPRLPGFMFYSVTLIFTCEI